MKHIVMRLSLLALGFCVIFVCVASDKTYYTILYDNLGCWNDTHERAIATAEGHPLLRDPCHLRLDAVEKCARVAHLLGYDVFAVQNGGWCYTSKSALTTYRRYGPSDACQVDGKGGPLANQVYQIYRVVKVETCDMGCWRDTSDRAIPTLENLDNVLMGSYRNRTNAIAKCVEAGARRGYRMVAIQDGGWCAGAKDAHKTYQKYGKCSEACDVDGKGGLWANQVYQLEYQWIKHES